MKALLCCDNCLCKWIHVLHKVLLRHRHLNFIIQVKDINESVRWLLILSQKIFLFLNLHLLCINPGMVLQPPSSPPANSLKKYKMVNYFFCRVIFFPFMLWWTIIVVSSTPLGSVFIKFFPEKQLFANLPLRSQVWGTIL